MRYLKIFAFAFLAALLVQPVFAAQKNSDITHQELSNFDRFLDNHPAIDKELRKNPSLVNDPNYLSAHPQLKEFLEKHPGVREEIRENPNAFMNRERHFEQSGRDISREEVKTFDEFLDQHPAINNELARHPELANDSAYVARHPELKEFLALHPAIRKDLAEHPRAFMRREKKYEKTEPKTE
jgi:phage-related protein